MTADLEGNLKLRFWTKIMTTKLSVKSFVVKNSCSLKFEVILREKILTVFTIRSKRIPLIQFFSEG